uniref:DNA polymerase V n=1 Tax=Ascaris lumbricoides TaxID=6252 RepID=A0A9J2P0T1_ASCLU
MRPSEDVLASFYDLADLDENKRFNAIISILDACKSNGEYCIERLIGGLASSRAAARLGYATALTHALSTFANDWPAKALFELADNKLDLNKAVADELAERELIILDKHRYFAMACSQSLAMLSKQLDRRTFEKTIWTRVKGRVCKVLESSTPEWMFFALLIRDTFKRTDGCAEGILARELLNAAREADNFNLIYSNIVQKWLQSGDSHKVFERSFEFVSEILSEDNLEPSELIVIFSPNLIANLRTLRKSHEYRFYGSIVESILEGLEKVNELLKSLSSGKWKRSELLTLLDNIDSTGGGNFDEYLRGKLRITEKIIAQLDRKGVDSIVKKALNTGGWSVRRIASIFPVWSENVREEVLVKLVKSETRSEEKAAKSARNTCGQVKHCSGLRVNALEFSRIGFGLQEIAIGTVVRPVSNDSSFRVHTTLCKCVDSMFVVNVRAGRSVKVALSEANENMLRNVLNTCAKKIKLPSSESRSLIVLALILNLWSITCPDEEQRKGYLKGVAEVVSIGKKLSKENTDEPYSVLIDLLLSLLSRPHRYHRTLVHFVFASILPQLNIQNLLHIFETLSLPDDEMMTDEKDQEDDSEDLMSIEDQHVDSGDEQNEENEDTDDSEGSQLDSELESSGSDGEVEDEQVDEEFKGKLKAALGDAAMPSDAEDDDDKGSIESTVSDETMFRLDAGLAAVFRERMKGTRKASASTLEQIHQFRMKCFDLLLFVVSHEEGGKFTADFILPLLRIARESLQKKNGEVVFNKATSLLEIIVKHKKGDVSEKKAMKLLKKMIVASSQIVNPVLRTLVGTISSFLFSTAYNVETQTVSEKMLSQAEELFSSYMTQTDNQILSELATAPLFKYPWVFTSFLPRIIDYAFNDEIRIYRRAKESKANEKLWKKVAKKIAGHMHSYLSALNADDAKPRFFALAVKLLIAFAGVASPERKRQLSEELDGDLCSLCENEDLWKAGGTMKRFNSASQTICGRNTLAALRQARVLINAF